MSLLPPWRRADPRAPRAEDLNSRSIATAAGMFRQLSRVREPPWASNLNQTRAGVEVSTSVVTTEIMLSQIQGVGLWVTIYGLT